MKLILEAIKSLFRKIEASRTHWDTRQTVTEKLTFDGVLEGKEYIESNGLFLVKMSDAPPAIEDVIGGKFTVSEAGETVDMDILEDEIDRLDETAYFVGGDAITVVLVGEHSFAEGLAVSKGVWFFAAADDNGELVFYASSLEYTHTEGELKRLDEKYLPESVAEGIANAQTTADNAQTAADNAQTAADNAQTAAENALQWQIAGSIPLGSTGKVNVTIPMKFTELRITGGLKNENSATRSVEVLLNTAVMSNQVDVRANAWNMVFFGAEIFSSYMHHVSSNGQSDGTRHLIYGATSVSNWINNGENIVGISLPDGISVYGYPIEVRWR